MDRGGWEDGTESLRRINDCPLVTDAIYSFENAVIDADINMKDIKLLKHEPYCLV